MKKYLLLILSFLFLFASSTEAGMLRHNRAQHLSGLWRLYQIDPTGLVSWQKQRDPRTGSSAALWNDLSGQDNDMAQVTSGNQPTVVTGRSGYRTFDGTTDFMSQAEQDDETGATFWP